MNLRFQSFFLFRNFNWEVRFHFDFSSSFFQFVVQISDFGLAKWLPEKWVHHIVSPIEGTFGYVKFSSIAFLDVLVR